MSSSCLTGILKLGTSELGKGQSDTRAPEEDNGSFEK